MEPVGFTPMDRPMYMTISEGKMYILLRAPFSDETSGLISYDISAEGTLTNPSGILSTRGVVACHLCADHQQIYAVNYISGSVIRFPERLKVHSGNSIHPTRQTSPHTHFIGLAPDQKHLLVTDLGTDQIVVYDKELNKISVVSLPIGHGPRHLVCHADGVHVFCVNELASTVSVLRYENSKLLLLDTVSALPEGYTGESTAAAIRCIGNQVYTSNRGHDSVSIFTFRQERLFLKDIIPTHGGSPRDFIITGQYVLAANETDNSICMLSLEEPERYRKYVCSHPICLVTDDLSAGNMQI